MKYYKILTGFRPEDYIEIDETELEKAYACFLVKMDGAFSGGAIRGSRIEMIKPDYHRIMNWNRGYELKAVDYEDLKSKGIEKACREQLNTSKEKVEYLVRTNQLELIGKPMPELAKKQPVPELDTSALAKKMRI